MILTFVTYAQIVTELTPRLPLIVTHSLTIHDQKGSLPCRKFKGQCKIKRELFLGGAFLYFQIPFSDHHGWNFLNAICGRHIFTAISFCPSSYILPMTKRNITHSETSSHSCRAQAEGPPTTVDQQATCRQKKPDKTNSNLHKSIRTFSRPKKVKLLW